MPEIRSSATLALLATTNREVEMIKKGDIVKIKPEYQDKGDPKFNWVARDDESKGRVTISPINIGLNFPPRQTVTVDMLDQGVASLEWKVAR